MPLSLTGAGTSSVSGAQNWAVVDTGLLDVKLLTLDQVAPNNENANNGTYPVVRPLNIITEDPPDDVVQRWLEFIASPKGQKIVESTGHNPSPQ